MDDKSFEAEPDNSINSPHVMEAKEKENNLAILRSSATRLVSDLKSIEQIISTSENSAEDILSFINKSKLDIEIEKRLKIDNQKLSSKNAVLNGQLKQYADRSQKNTAEISALKQRNEQIKSTLDQARVTFADLREKNYQLTNETDQKNREILNLTARNTELAENYDDIDSKFRVVNDQHQALTQSFEVQVKNESDLQRQLVESNSMLDEEINKSRNTTGDLESAKRELSELNSSLISMKSDYHASLQESEYLKNSREDDQRKFDNRLFNMRSEIDSLVSERRINQQAINDLKTENKLLRKSTTDAETAVNELRNELNKVQKTHEQERAQFVENHEKLSSLNLRYNTALTDLKHEQSERKLLEQKVEDYSDEMQRLRGYKEKYDAVYNQVSELKSLVGEYQQLLEKRNSISDYEPPSISDDDDGSSDEFDRADRDQNTIQ